ncbi:MAG: DNA repair protein RecN [Clostridiaceae bacterium]|nr:DNA repair protein RecN [Clostridiaceae bacterium]
MLRSLSIENIAVIERADIDFEDGFSVLSGETGAGKSIIIDSINAILGFRVSRELIRTGTSAAFVSAYFDKIDKSAMDKAREMGFDIHDDTIIISREMYLDGRNLCKINGKPAVLSMLRDLSGMLVNIHGQHDGQNLLDEALHIDYLDAFAGLHGQLSLFAERYDTLLQLNRNIKSLSLSNADKQRRAEMLAGYVDELKKAEIEEGEYQNLLTLRSSLIRSEKLGSSLSEAMLLIAGDEEKSGALTLVSESVKELESCRGMDGSIPSILSSARDIEALLGDLSSEISKNFFKLEFSPELLRDTEKRLDIINELSEKHKTEPDFLPKLLKELESELSALMGTEDNLEELKARYVSIRNEVFALAKDLTSKRLDASGRLSMLVGQELEQLDMPSAIMTVEIESQDNPKGVRFTRKGIDTVRFLLSTNKGESLKPLNKVASGGELSRIMLAIKKVLSASEPSCTAIFDEIDTGVSGRAANKVGQKLYEISLGRQVLCITHLPQIACLADHHYRITKHEEGERTYTKVELLSTAGRIEEISRLTSGINITQASLESARDMLSMALDYKKSLTK